METRVGKFSCPSNGGTSISFRTLRGPYLMSLANYQKPCSHATFFDMPSQSSQMGTLMWQ